MKRTGRTKKTRKTSTTNKVALPTVSKADGNALPNAKKGGNIYPANDEPKSYDKVTSNDNPDPRSIEDTDEGDLALLKSYIENYANGDAEYKKALLTFVENEDFESAETLIFCRTELEDASIDAGETPIPIIVAAYEGCLKCAKLLRGEDINEEYRTPLKRAIATKDFDTVKSLIEHGADVNETGGTRGSIPFTYVLDQDFVDRLLEHDADKVPWAYTPLSMAISVEEFDITKLLLESGADPNELNSNGVSPLDIAKRRNRPDIVELLREYGAEE